MDDQDHTNAPEGNPDPITKTPGAHPLGAGIGAAAGGAVAAGAAMSVVGPVGTVIGAAVGALAGGLMGKAAAEQLNPTAEHEYWRENYVKRPYVDPAIPYKVYGPAYQYGWEAYARYYGKAFADVESELARDWEKGRGDSTLEWHQAREASSDAWHRIASSKSTDPPREKQQGTSARRGDSE